MNSGLVPIQPSGAVIEPSPEKLEEMNASAAENSSPAINSVLPCEKISWFAIRVIDEKDGVVEGLSLHLKLTEIGDTERVTSKVVDPVKIESLAPGGKGDVKYIDSGEVVWEAIGDIT